MKTRLTFLLLAVWISLNAQEISQKEQNRIFWKISGNHSITWNLVAGIHLPHSDNIEMSGKRVAAIITYTVDENRKLTVSRDVIFPQLRIFIESSANMWRKYRAYLRGVYSDDYLPVIVVEKRTFEPGPVDSIRINGMIRFFHSPSQGLQLERTLLPSMNQRMLTENWKITNTSGKTKELDIGKTELLKTQIGQNGYFTRKVYADAAGKVNIGPGKTFEFTVYFTARLDNEKPAGGTYREVLAERDAFLDTIRHNLMLETPDPVLNTLFYFSKIRVAESIYDTKMGLVHSPGGGRYYAGVWANDQAEYSGPFFPFLGYKTGDIAAMNAYRQFLKNIPEGDGHFWSSFEMEGTLTCCGADRGDAAMIAYGASQYALYSGSKTEAEELWPLITWSLDYCERQKNEQGVINSDSDEMEGRVSTGRANLATSSLYYGALVQSVKLAEALGDKKAAKEYNKRAEELRKAIAGYFNADIEGLKTYQYYKGYPYLRHWICLPLVMGINDRKEGTLDALFNKLWTNNGVRVEYNPNMKEPDLFWDRGTLYAFRGAFKAGAANRAEEKLHAYSQTRLLGFHVPYVVEAWPEGNMAHLSAESALYCRIFTEGVLGIFATGFKSFELTPNIPDDWNFYNLKNIRAFGSDFDVLINRERDKLHLRIVENNKTILDKKIKNGQTVKVIL
ncbi:MAG: six-hairpin glycosidase-like protein [Chlorobi bacterium]|nr:six-hairpin glycosidase-like protein [Chlorobiota bacterium]